MRPESNESAACCDRDEGIRLEDVSSYLVLLQRNSIKPLIKLLGELKNSKTRRVLCDALSEIGKNAIELIIPFMEDRRWYLVRNITYILVGSDRSKPFPMFRRPSAMRMSELGVKPSRPWESSEGKRRLDCW